MQRFGYKSAIGSCALVLLAGVGLPHAAKAAERIALTNGFNMVCHHHVEVEGRVRVYMNAADTDYVELKADAVSGIETVPDPPVEVKNAEAVAPPVTQPAVTVGKASDARLTADDLHELLSRASTEHNVDEDLLASVVKMESGGYVRARSHAGAQGLMQLMPGTAKQLGVADSFAPEQNVRGGSAYLDSLLTRYHDNIALALAAYNAGPEAVDRYHGIPPYHETRVYVARVVHEFNRRVLARQKQAQRDVAFTTNGTR